MKLKKQNTLLLAIIALTLILIVPVVSSGVRSNKKEQAEKFAFEKKKECASYLDEINKKIPKGGKLEGTTIIHELDEVWYSPTLNSCLYSIKSTISATDSSFETIPVYVIYDYLTNKEVPLMFNLGAPIGDNTRNDHHERYEYTKAETKKERVN